MKRVYDQGERLVADTAADGNVEKRFYDEASNLTKLITRRGDTLTMTYDAMNRLKSRTVPARLYPRDTVGLATIKPNNPQVNPSYPRKRNDPAGYLIGAETHEFDYTELGLISSARNPHAHVTRTYHPNGLLASETDSIRTVAGGDLSQHVYRIGYEYDLNGRLRLLRYPSQLVQSPSNAGDSVVYSYNAQTGQVAQVRDLLDKPFTYTHDNAGQLVQLEMPGGVRESFGYDGAGRLRGDTIRLATNALLRATAFTYGDARGKVTSSVNSVLKQDALSATYSGLGFVVASTYADLGTDYRGFAQAFASADAFTYDALGNILLSTTSITNGTQSVEESHTSTGRNYHYDAVTGRLVLMLGDPRPDSLVYDKAGNVQFQYTRSNNAPVREDRMSYFAADGTLRATDHRTRVAAGNVFTFTFEEYWYDALGRRVLTRTQQECDPSDYDLDVCSLSSVRRTLWDGAQELFEIQMPDSTALAENDTNLLSNLGVTESANPISRNPFYGRVGYTNGPGLDQPLSVTRWGYADTAFVGTAQQRQFEQWKEPFTIVPHWNARGQADYGTTAAGAGGAPCAGGTPPGGGASSGRCALVYWPYGWTAYWKKTYRQPTWNGTLLDQKRDGSQLLFKRNRYYDPATGRFTQEDPIGLAGGMNLYGFASGDPINSSDPFGLIVWPLWVIRGALWIGARLGISAGAAGVATQVARNPTVQELADDAVRATAPLAKQLGARIFEIGRHVGNRSPGQQAAVDAIEKAVGRIADMGPTVTINGVRYITAARTRADGALDAIAVAANGGTTRAIVRFGQHGWELVDNVGPITPAIR
jgi:RHS repeat-associated protein